MNCQVFQAGYFPFPGLLKESIGPISSPSLYLWLFFFILDPIIHLIHDNHRSLGTHFSGNGESPIDPWLKSTEIKQSIGSSFPFSRAERGNLNILFWKNRIALNLCLRQPDRSCSSSVPNQTKEEEEEENRNRKWILAVAIRARTMSGWEGEDGLNWFRSAKGLYRHFLAGRVIMVPTKANGALLTSLSQQLNSYRTKRLRSQETETETARRWIL